MVLDLTLEYGYATPPPPVMVRVILERLVNELDQLERQMRLGDELGRQQLADRLEHALTLASAVLDVIPPAA